MAYSATGLQPIGGQSKAGNAPQVWSYTSTDAATVIRVAGYFNSAADLLKVGDLIWVHHTRYLAGVADACLNGGAVQVNIED